MEGQLQLFTCIVGWTRVEQVAPIKRIALAIAAIVACTGIGATAAIVPLGDAETFVVLAGSTVTNTGASTIVGDLGVSPGTAITGFPPGTVTGGTIHSNDALAIQAQQDAAIAYNALQSMTFTQDLTGQDLGGMILTPGVYRFSTSAQLTGLLTLDGQGQTNPCFIFQIGSTLTTASNSSVVVINGANPFDAFFQVGSSATLGSSTEFLGTIIANTSNTLTTGVQLNGRVLALNGAVTLDNSNITGPITAIPAPPAALAGLVLLGVFGWMRYRGTM